MIQSAAALWIKIEERRMSKLFFKVNELKNIQNPVDLQYTP